MKTRSLLAAAILVLLSMAPAWGEVAYTRYKYGTWYSSPGCCNTIYAQDYDCQGRVIASPYNPFGKGCYDTGSGSYIYGTCGGGCIMPTCGGRPTKICVNEQANIGCGNCSVFLEPLAGWPPANCTSQVDPACAERWGCGTMGGYSCYTLPYDGDGDLASGYLCDQRTEQMISAGCQPPDLSCPTLGNFRADTTTINRSTGQGANLAGSVSAPLGSSFTWSLTLAGQTITGSGIGVSKFWDGKDSEKKQVWPGVYEAALGVKSSGICGTSEPKSVSIEVKANDQPVASAVDLGICFGSAVNVASGNLSHSQTLFYLPPSKFQGDFSLFYNSFSGQKTPLGTGWSHTFHIYLHANNNGSYTLVEGDGGRITLYKNGDRYTPEYGSYPFLLIEADGTSVLEKKEGIFYRFDQKGEITRVLDRNGNAVVFAYDSRDNLVLITDPSGRIISLAYDLDNRISQITDPLGNVHTFSYAGQTLSALSSQVQGLGTLTWAYTYDTNGFLLTKTDPKGYVTSYAYDDEGRAVQVTDPEGRKRSMAYNPGESRSRLTEKDGGVWTFRYDAKLGALTEKADPLGNWTWYAYDQKRNLSSMIDSSLRRTSFTYDPDGNLTSTTDAAGNTTAYAYNALNKITGIVYPGNARVAMTYDEKGNLTSVTDPMNNLTRYGYDEKGNRTSVTDPLNRTTLFTYDASQYLTSLADPLGAVNEFLYDSSGRLVVYKDPLQNTATLEYNGLGKAARATDPMGNVVAYAYDFNGNMASVTDGNGKVTRYEYNDRGRVAKIIDALNHATLFTYGSGCPSCGSAVDKLISLTDARGKTTTFEYDAAGRLIKETDPAGRFKSYTYDSVGNRVSRTDEEGAVTRYVYDSLSRLTQVWYPDGRTNTFGYDSRGNLTYAENSNIWYSLAYDLNNRLVSVRDYDDKVIRYEYNGLNRRTGMVTPDGRTIAYSYDAGNRLSGITSPAGVFEMGYDQAGRRMMLTYPNGVTTAYSYDASSFLTHLLVRDNQQTDINSFTYTPDGMGNRVSMTDLAGVHHYTYDPTYQLTQAMHPNIPTEIFSYDQVGNRLSSEGQGPTVARNSEYIYDFENRLKAVTYQGMDAQYKYDPFGRRIEKNVNGVITRYLYDGPNIIAEYDGAWNVKARYTHSLAIDDPLTITQGPNTFYYHPDGLGSVVNLTDASGNVAKGYTYKSFGEVHQETGSLVQPFTFTGREYDEETGLYYYRARYYDPMPGRFLTKDPIGFAGGDVNLYRYVFNNPVNWVDSSGMLGGPDHFWIALYSGLAEGYSVGQSLAMAWQSAWTDWGTQFASILHAMSPRDPVTGQFLSREQAIAAFGDRLAKESKCGKYGTGQHMVVDFVTPPHGPGKPWLSNNPFTNPEMIPHYLGEMFLSKETIKDAIAISRGYLRSLKAY